MDSDDAFQAILGQIRESIGIAIRDVMTCQPNMIMGMSSETFWGGVAGNARFIERVRSQSGLDVSTGASACRAALERYGVTRIAVLSPYQPIADRQVTEFFEQSGFTVVRFKGLRCPTATSIAEVPEAPLRKILGESERPRRRGHRSGGDEPVHGPPCRRGRALARQARAGHQRRHPLARPPGLWPRGPAARLRLSPARALRRGGTVPPVAWPSRDGESRPREEGNP